MRLLTKALLALSLSLVATPALAVSCSTVDFTHMTESELILVKRACDAEENPAYRYNSADHWNAVSLRFVQGVSQRAAVLHETPQQYLQSSLGAQTRFMMLFVAYHADIAALLIMLFIWTTTFIVLSRLARHVTEFEERRFLWWTRRVPVSYEYHSNPSEAAMISLLYVVIATAGSLLTFGVMGS